MSLIDTFEIANNYNGLIIEGVQPQRAFFMALQDCTPVAPEMLPIVQELREKLARYEMAEKERHLFIVPEKLFDVIHDEAAPELSYIVERQTEGGYIKFAGDYISTDEIGKTVFLTEEEAEAALKRRGSN